MRSTLLLLLLGLPAAEPQDPGPPPAARPLQLSAPAPAPSGDVVLAEVITLLEQGDFRRALELAIPAISAHPHLAPSFRAAADLAMDQLHRQGATAVYLNPTPGSLPPSAGPRELRFGFDAGTMTGVRIEWSRPGSRIDGIGFRTGTGLMVYSSVIFTGHAAAYIDWRLNDKLQLETPLGILFYGASPYPLIQLGLQVNPPGKPMHFNIGIGYLSGFLPDLGVGFLW